MKIKWKRLWSSLLVVVMLVSLLPAALAEGTDESTTTVTIYHSMVYDSKTLSSSEDLAKLNIDWNPGDGSFTETVETAVTEDGNIKLPAPQESVVEYMDSTKRIPVATWTCVGYLSNSDWQSTVEVTNWSNVTVSSDYYIMYIWTRTAYPTSKVSYNFGIAEDGEAAKTGQLPAGAVILQLTEGDVQLGTAYTGSSSVIADVVQGLPISNVPATGAFDKVVDFIAYKNSPDEDGKTVRTWYEFQGWQKIKDDSDDSGAEEAIALYSVEEELDADADEELIVGESAMNLVAQWREISAEELASYANEDGAPALGLTKKYTVDGKEYDSKISQHSSSTTWSENGAKTPLELDSNRQVYYKATMEMDSGIAKLLETGGNIQNPEFAGFTINVELDKQLELVTDANGAVTFKFTCTFLEPTGKILDSDEKEIDCSTITKGSTTYYFTVLANDLPNEFNIPVQWKPGAYEAGAPKQEGTLQEEISLEVAAAKVPGEDEQTVMTTGVITGYIDLTKAGQNESDIVYAILSQDAWVKYYGDENGNISALSALKANEHLKYAIKNLVLNANKVYAHVDGPEPEPIVPEWEVSKSKTATNLEKQDDGTYTSKVTLGLPSAEIAPVTDVVFVLDRSSSSNAADAKTAINSMLANLAGIVKDSDATVKVGVVGFDYDAYTLLDLTELTADNLSNIQTAVTDKTVSGTNIEAGIEAGVAMLDADTAVDANNKYLILLTDGISHSWTDENGEVVQVWGQGIADLSTVFNGANSYYYFDTTKTPFSKIYALSETDSKLNSGYEVPVYVDANTLLSATNLTDKNSAYYNKYIKYTSSDDNEYGTYLSGTEKGVYTAAHAYADAASKYRCISVYWTTKDYDVANEFMEWTATQGKAYDITDTNALSKAFENVQKDILYVLDEGSRVEDYMGYVADDYDFDFVNDASSMTLKVGGTTYTAEVIETNKYGFNKKTDGTYAYIVEYIKGDGKNGEHFVWNINEAVTIAKPVELTYTVKLVNPKDKAGTYGVYDRDGSKERAGLYTNNSATLYPVDSNGEDNYVPEDFPKPTVSYTVDAKPVNGALSISKTVNNGDLNREFVFTVILTDANDKPLTERYDYTGSKTGNIASGGTVTLKNGQSIAINQLPGGTKYTVTETAEEGYTTTISGHDATEPYEGTSNTGVIVAGAAAEVHFTNTATTPVNSDKPSMTVLKELSEVNSKTYRGGRVEVGDKLTYTITVENTGNIALENVLVTDELPEDATFVDASKGYQYDKYSHEVTWTVDLAEDQTETFTVTVKVDDVDEGTRLLNTAVAECEDLREKYSVSVRVDEDDPYIPPVRPSKPDPKPVTPAEPDKPALNIEDHVAYIIGYEDGTVRPENNITRAEVATIFFRLLTTESRAYYWCQTNEYSDVDSGDWFNNAVSTLSNAGIITGYPDGTFLPNAPISRAEFATIAARFSDVVYSGDSSFIDVSATHWAARYIALAEYLGWITGYPDGSFKPDQNITRAEAMTLINRVLERAVEEEHMLPDMVTWTDNLPDAWYYEAVQEATNSHEYVRLAELVPGQDFCYEDWQEINAVPDWAALEKAWSTANSK